MKSLESSKNTNTKGAVVPPPVRPGRFRFPFKQKSTFSLGTTATGVSPVSTSPPASGFFSRKFGAKPSTPVLAVRKSVSFSGGRGSPGKDSNMDWKKKITADHTDVAYREAVGRLRAILSPRPTSRTIGDSPIKTDKSDVGSPSRMSGSPVFTPDRKDGRFASGFRSMFSKDSHSQNQLNNQPPPYIPYRPVVYNSNFSDSANQQREDDLFGFIEKQGEYISQLEKETKYSRDELSVMLEKVKDVISENESLHDKKKKDLLANMIDQLNEKTDGYTSDSGPKTPTKKSNLVGGSGGQSGGSNVILESRVAELDAQLSQARRGLRLAQEEILNMRKGKLAGINTVGGTDGDLSHAINNNNIYANCDLHRAEIDTLVSEKSGLLDTMTKLKQMVNELRDRESDAAKKVKNSLDIVEQMQVEKAQSDMETRRLKEELDRYQQRIREMIQDHSRRLHEETLQVEKKYKQELDHLNNEMNLEMDSLTKARLDLERQRRVEADLKRELQQKVCTIEDLRQEMQMKMSHMQTELAHVLAQKSSIDQELINCRLNSEKTERDGKQDAARLQSEINGLRKRLEQSDVELVMSQEMVMQLNETISQLKRESSLAKIRLEGHISANPELQDADVVTVIQNMEDKHSRDMTDLEHLIQDQNGLLDKLRNECKLLTEKLEDTTRQHKKERALLQTDRDKHSQISKVSQEKCVELEQRVQFYSSSHEQMTSRLHKLEEDDKTRSARIFQLLTKQSGLLRENQNLQNEMALVKTKLTDQHSGSGNRNM